MKELFKGKTILVTGGCGSIGSEIVKQLLEFDPEAIRVFDNKEDGHFRLNQSIVSKKLRNLIGDIRNVERIDRAMEGVDIVFHAAALKHVPFCEYNPFEAVSTNVIGTSNLVNMAIRHKVKIFVGISTDKAVNPINTMGATKLLAEKIITNAPIGKSHVKFCCVRFGNVLDSAGSVIPIFREQIKKGGPISITDPEMTRFFMSLSESAKLVLKSAKQVQGGEIFVLKMKALKILDLAEVLIEYLSPTYGKNQKDIKYKYIGKRPGEKMHEYLVTDEEAQYTTASEDMFIIRNSLLSDYNQNRKASVEQIDEIYSSGKVQLLGKEEIKKILKEEKII